MMSAPVTAGVKSCLQGWRTSRLFVGLLVGLAVGAAQSSGFARNVEPPFKNVELKNITGAGVVPGNATPYRTLTLHDGKLFVGAKDLLSSLNTSNLETLSNVSIESSSASTDCADYCDNYITVVRLLNNGDLLVCGTNSFDTYCRQRSPEDLNVSGPEQTFPRTESLVPFVPNQNFSFLITDGTADDSYEIFTGTHLNVLSSGDLSKATFVRAAMTASSSDTSINMSLRLKFSALNDPQFVGDPIEYNDRIYFFFREISVEREKFQMEIYSRVGVVCKNDKGGQISFPFTEKQMMTFAKARLDCSILGKFPFHYNLIRDVYQSKVTKEVVFAVFAPSIYVRSSAVCAFRLDEIEELFLSGSQYNADIESSGFVAQIPDPVSPRPASCPDTHGYSSAQHVLIESKAQLMYNSAENRLNYESPDTPKESALLQLHGESPTQIVVDEDVISSTDVMFIGTETGAVVKAFLSSDRSKATVVERIILNPASKARVLTMVKSDAEEALFVGTDEGVYKIPLQHCRDYGSREACVDARDPYCKWTENSVCAHTIEDGLQDLENGYVDPAAAGIMIRFRPKKEVLKKPGKPRFLALVAETRPGKHLALGDCRCERTSSQSSVAVCADLDHRVYQSPSADVLLAYGYAPEVNDSYSCSLTVRNDDAQTTVKFDVINDTSVLLIDNYPKCKDKLVKFDDEIRAFQRTLQKALEIKVPLV